MKLNRMGIWSVCLGFMIATVPAAAVEIQTILVGDPGNPGELSGVGAGGFGEDRVCGAVDQVYAIGKFEVTAGQYCEFLNAVADTDTYGLYNENMVDNVWPFHNGCGIARTGTEGNYSYSVGTGWVDRPVNFVSWGDATRFCNWLTNGQTSGAQDASTTEDGSYALNSANDDASLLAITRKAGAVYFLPTEDEWYKAAYYDLAKPGGAGYWDFATRTDAVPSNDLINPDPGNHANFWVSPDEIISLDDFTIGRPYFTTEVGEFEISASAYDTYDQAGNVSEWHEGRLTYFGFPLRGAGGGGFPNHSGEISAKWRLGNFPTAEAANVGFRVAWVPEPATLGLLLLGGLGLLKRRR